MTAKPAEAADLVQVLRALNRIEVKQARMDEKLDALTGPRGRMANIEDDIEKYGVLLASHETKINQARGGIAVIAFLLTAAEALFHKVWK